ncbi:hypothetical protein OHS18_15990 [Amycolatopsis sp. NBC_00355]|uniref:hypothetical protein n=1 Tax=Amycolatopsis sp. NBC_00355 TaxID=2975957 RepID=UPI002E253EC8
MLCTSSTPARVSPWLALATTIRVCCSGIPSTSWSGASQEKAASPAPGTATAGFPHVFATRSATTRGVPCPGARICSWNAAASWNLLW